jgi:phospholipid/cholesterol/gamma-HCH transport system substrate-binding protein
MESRSHAIMAGVSVLLLAGLLLAGVFWLHGTGVRGLPYDLITRTSVAGLVPGAPVRLQGVDIGQVQHISLDDKDPRRVRAVLRPDLHLMQGTEATIRYLGLAGNAYIELDYPESATRPLATSATAPARIPLHASPGLTQLSDAASELTGAVTHTLERIDALLTPETTRHVSQAIVHLDDAAVQLSALAHHLRTPAEHLDTAIVDADQLIRSSHTTVEHLDDFLANVQAPGNVLDSVRSTALDAGDAAHHIDRALREETLPRIDELAERLAATSDQLSQLLGQIRDQPQSLVFGRPAPLPDPGDPSFPGRAKK